MMEASHKCDELEESCKKLEEEKYNVEKELLTTRDLAQKLDMRRNQAEGEVARLSTSLEKVVCHHTCLGFIYHQTKVC